MDLTALSHSLRYRHPHPHPPPDKPQISADILLADKDEISPESLLSSSGGCFPLRKAEGDSRVSAKQFGFKGGEANGPPAGGCCAAGSASPGRRAGGAGGPQTAMPHAISCRALGVAGRSCPSFQPSDVISVLRNEWGFVWVGLFWAFFCTPNSTKVGRCGCVRRPRVLCAGSMVGAMIVCDWLGDRAWLLSCD